MHSQSYLAILAFLLLGALEFHGVLAARSSGCGKAAGITSGTKTMTVNGKQRQYIVRVPNNYDSSKAYKLIFGYHWYGGTMTDVATGQTVQRDVWDYYGLRRLAGENVIFVAPQGLNNGWANSGGEDLTFTDQMIQNIESNLCVETTLRFATGFSYGGAMSYSIACSRAVGTYAFRAVAVLSGAGLSGCSGGTNPLPYLGIHGVRDNPAGGRSLRDTFVRNNGCAAQNAPEPAQGSLTHIKTSYSCRAGYPVVWIAFDAGHIAAPHDGSTGDSGSQTFSPGETWNFFNQFTANGGTTPPSPPASSSTSRPGATQTASPPNPGTCSPLYAQCGGQGWTGPKCCSQGSCKFSNDWYSQCL